MDVLGSRSSGTLGTPSVLSAQKKTTEPNDVYSNFIQQIMDEHLPCALGCGEPSRKQCKCSLWPQGDIPVCSEQIGVQCSSHSVSHKTQQGARSTVMAGEKESGSSVWREVKVKDAKVCVHHPPSPSTIQERRTISVLIAPKIWDGVPRDLRFHIGEEGKHEAGLIFIWAGVWPHPPSWCWAAAVAHSVVNYITTNAHGCSELSGHSFQ